MIKDRKTLIRKLKSGAKEGELSQDLFDTDLPDVNTVRVASGRSKQIGPDEWVSDGTEYLIRVVK